MISVTIEAEDGTEKATLDGISATWDEALGGESSSGSVDVYRDDWIGLGISISRSDVVRAETGDRVIVEGVFKDDDSNGARVTLDVDSPERAGKDARPTGALEEYLHQPDSDVVLDAIDAVPRWEEGTVETLADDISFTFSLAGRDKQCHDVAEATGGELSFEGFVVDYVEQLGTDRDRTIGPGRQTISEEVRVVKDEERQPTHVIGIGALNGPDSRLVLAAPESDGRDFESEADWNRVIRYSNPGWSDPEDDVWRQYDQKESIELDRLEEIVTRIVDGLGDGEPEFTVQTTIVDVDVSLGDRFPVEHPDHGVDRDLRVIELSTTAGEEGLVFDATLSNRTPIRDGGGRKRRRELQQFTRGYQGFVDRDTQASGWDNAGDGTPQTLTVPNWPDDIVDERTVELTVQGRAWRSPIRMLEHDHDLTIDVTGHTHEFDATHSHETSGHSHSFDASHDHQVLGHSHSFDASHDHQVLGHTHSFDATHSHGVQGHTHSFDATHSHGVQGHTHQIEATSEDNTEFSNLPIFESAAAGHTFDGSWNDVISISVDSTEDSTSFALVNVRVYWYLQNPDAEYFGQVDTRLFTSAGDQNFMPDSDGFSRQIEFELPDGYDLNQRITHWTHTFLVGSDISGETFILQVRGQDAGTNYSTWWEMDVAGVGTHIHQIDDTSKSASEVVEETVIGTSTESASEVIEEEVIAASTENASEVVEEELISTTTESASEVVQTEVVADTTFSASEVIEEELISETTEADGAISETETSSTAVGAEPAVVTEFDGESFYPSADGEDKIEIAVNGTVVAELDGDGAGDWSETVDLAGELTPGENTISATPPTRGEMNLVLSSELFRRGRSS